MEDIKRVSIRKHHAYDGNSDDLPSLCECCGSEKDVSRYIVNINGDMLVCEDCLKALVDEAAHILHKSVRVGDTIYELFLYGGEWRVMPMTVKDVSMYGSVRQVKGKDPMVWNIYAESDSYTYVYKNFYDAGETLFFTKEDADAALKQKQAGI